MKVIINDLTHEAYTKLIELYGKMIFQSIAYDESQGTYRVVLNKYAIVKTGVDEVKIDLGARCYYLSRQDFRTIEVF